MDTRLNPNRPDTTAYTDEATHGDIPAARKRGRTNRPLGILLLTAAVGLLTVGLLGWFSVKNANGGYFIQGMEGTGVEIKYPNHLRDFIYGFAQRMEALEHAASDSTVIGVDNGGQTAYPIEYTQAEAELANAADFKYRLYDAAASRWYTNIAQEEEESFYADRSLLVLSLNSLPAVLTDYDNGYDINEIAQRLRNQGLAGEIYIPYSAMDTDSTLSYALRNDNYAKIMLDTYRMLALVGIGGCMVVLALGLFVYRPSFVWAFSKTYGWYGRQPLLMKLPLALVSWLLLFDMYKGYGGMYPVDLDPPLFLLNCVVVLYAVVSAFYLVALLSGGRRMLRSEPDIRWLLRSLRDMRILFQSRNKLLITVFLLDVLGMLTLVYLGLLGTVYMVDGDGAGLLVLLMAIAGLFITGLFMSMMLVYAKALLYTGEIAAGCYREYPLEKGLFTRPLANLSQINTGMRKAVEEAVRSERLKTELVTNVSHDLKTPLTSIMNYVALLKETSVAQSASAAEYLAVIDKKTQRMQALIDDLFEAVKLNSGSVTLHPSHVNVADLLKQAMGELNERMEASAVQFICRYASDRVMVWLDGKKLWRVFENLIDNIIKYAPAGSRAYIDVAVCENTAVLTFRNVSSYALDFEPEELFERFKRGDASRSTEGNGLGLSIARGIVTQSGGTMDILFDGDLFKVVLTFPL